MDEVYCVVDENGTVLFSGSLADCFSEINARTELYSDIKGLMIVPFSTTECKL